MTWVMTRTHALPSDEHISVRRDGSQLCCVYHARQHLNEGDLQLGEGGRQHLDVEGLAHDELGEGAPHVAAGDLVADLQADDAAPHHVDRARHLVAEARRRRHELGLARAAEGLEVAAADAAGVDAHEDFVVGGLRGGKVGQFELAGAGEEEGFHGERGRVQVGVAGWF